MECICQQNEKPQSTRKLIKKSINSNAYIYFIQKIMRSISHIFHCIWTFDIIEKFKLTEIIGNFNRRI